jgi:uncharacterized membrane protein
MSNQPPYGNPPGGYPPPPPGGGYQGGGYPPPEGGGYQQPGGFPPPGGYGYGGPPPEQKTKTLGLSYNIAALLCYVPACLCCVNLIAGILWLVTEPKENRFVRFHAMQGLLLFGVNFVVSIIFRILQVILGAGAAAVDSDVAFGGGSLILGLLQLVIGLGLLVVHIIGMVKANQGQMWKLPIIGDIAEKNS